MTTGAPAGEGTRMRLSASPPFRLGAVVVSHGWFQTAPFAWDGEGSVLRRVERLPGGPAAVAVRPAAAGVTVTTDRALDPRDRAELRVRMRRMLQLDVPMEGFLPAVGFDPELAGDLTAHGAGRLLAGTTLYEDVVKTICGTNTTWTQAVGAIGRIGAWGSDGAFPAPEVLLRKGEDGMRAEARIGYRAPYVVAAARSALDGTLAEIEAEVPDLDGRQLVRRLGELRGVGPASAAFLCLLLGRFDSLVIDSATTRIAARVWFGGRTPTKREIIARVEPAGAWCGLALYWAMARAWQREAGVAG